MNIKGYEIKDRDQDIFMNKMRQKLEIFDLCNVHMNQICGAL